MYKEKKQVWTSSSKWKYPISSNYIILFESKDAIATVGLLTKAI